MERHLCEERFKMYEKEDRSENLFLLIILSVTIEYNYSAKSCLCEI